MADQIELQAELLVQKMKHYLITTMGVTLENATDEEFYRAFCLTLREEIMINWTATAQTLAAKRPRIAYYLCMEYMPGRLLENNIANLHATELVQRVLKTVRRTFRNIMQFETDPGLGNGGLGRLASCLLDALATQQYPAFGYGLRYQYGIFEQEIWDGQQVERPEIWLLHENPWEFRRDAHAVNVSYSGKLVPMINRHGVEVYDLIEHEEVRALPFDIPIVGYRETPDYNVLSLRLWTTKESPRNFQLQRYNAGLLDQAAENTSLTDVLYPNDNFELGKRIRLKQEFLLASASIQDIVRDHVRVYGNLKDFADKVRIHINDTHPALVIPELTRILLKNDYDWASAWETVKTCCNYTNHTVLKESLEEWNISRLHYLLPRQYRMIERLNMELCDSIRKQYPMDEEKVRRMSIIEGGQVRMAHLAIYGSHRVNGVAELHTEILKYDIFKDFYEMFPDKFVNVTNGVTHRRWLLDANQKLSAFITKRIGKEWLTQFTKIRELHSFASDRQSQLEFLEIKKSNKRQLIEYLKTHNPVRDAQGKALYYSEPLGEDALYDIQIKRFHEYKRQLLNILHAIALYHELKENPESRKIKRQIVIAGKAAPGYTLMKNVIELIYCLMKKINHDPEVSQKLNIIFIENYNVSRAEIIIPAADLSEQISCAGLEASGTGNMKLSMNGALTIGTEDGANIEMHAAVTKQWWPFCFGQTAEENRKMHKERLYNPWDIYMKFPAIKKALDALKEGEFATTEVEKEAGLNLYRSLLESYNHRLADEFFVLNDFPSYYNAQKKVEELYLQPNKWAEYAIHNIASMGFFSSDESIKHYAELVWGLSPCPVDPQELTKVREQYSEHDKCRIIDALTT